MFSVQILTDGKDGLPDGYQYDEESQEDQKRFFKKFFIKISSIWLRQSYTVCGGQ